MVGWLEGKLDFGRLQSKYLIRFALDCQPFLQRKGSGQCSSEQNSNLSPQMASASCSAAHSLAFISTQKPRTISHAATYNHKAFSNHGAFQDSSIAKFLPVKAKATPRNRNTKPNSVICADCDGNGAVLCSQCQGSGVNSVDFFNGQFKAGDSCWLCGGKKRMLCGNCNGAGFIGGFMSTDDE
ncbi:hypothetical protein POUND7_011170 [Theobroma cacao]